MTSWWKLGGASVTVVYALELVVKGGDNNPLVVEGEEKQKATKEGRRNVNVRKRMKT